MDKNKARRAQRILEIAARMAKQVDGDGWLVQGRVEEIRLHFDGYAEPGYTEPECGIIATGNWNEVDRYVALTQTRVEVSHLPKRLGDIFEAMGIEIEWSDEWEECGQCNKLVRTSPDSHCYQPSYTVDNDELNCLDCIDPEGHVEEREGTTDLVLSSIDLAEHGYVKRNDAPYESGWHPGQTDDPQRVSEELRKEGITRFVFQKDEQSQFYSKWSVWVKVEDEEISA